MKKNIYFPTFILPTLFLIGSCQSASGPTKADEAAIREYVIEGFKPAWDANDEAAMTAFFLDDGDLTFPTSPWIRGRGDNQGVQSGAAGGAHHQPGKMNNVLLFALFTLSLLFACDNNKPNDPAADLAAIETQRNTHAEAAMAGDADQYVEFITDDAVYMPPGEAQLVGKETVRNWVNAAFETASFEITLYPVDEINISGDWAFARYRVTLAGRMKSDSSGFSMDRKYLDIWKKSDGTWKVYRHMWNDNPEE